MILRSQCCDSKPIGETFHDHLDRHCSISGFCSTCYDTTVFYAEYKQPFNLWTALKDSARYLGNHTYVGGI